MAYGEKYYVTYCDPQRVEYRLSIMEIDYSGSATAVKAGPIPFSPYIENSSELKVGGISPTTGIVTLVSSKTFNLEELYTTDETKYKVVHARSDNDPTRYWEGFIIPTSLSEEIDNQVHHIQMLASDRLSSLQGVKFLDDTGENYGNEDGQFEKSFLFAIKECLKRTGLNLPIRTMVNIKTLLSGESEQGGIFSRGMWAGNVSVEGANFLIVWDQDESIGRSLTPGMKVRVTGGTNDGKEFTIFSLDWAGEGADKRLSIVTVEPPISQEGRMENVQLSFDKPASGSTVSFGDPIAYATHDLRTYIDHASTKNDDDRKWLKAKPYYEFMDGTMMCWDVLKYICTTWYVRLIQNNGWWEIRRWGAEVAPAGTYEWFEYDAEGVFTGRSLFGKDVVFYCKPDQDVHMPFGHTMSMDRVLKRVTVRYNYRYKQDGDSLANLIQDGNFERITTDRDRWFWLMQPQALVPAALAPMPETSDLPVGIQTGVRVRGFARSRALTQPIGGHTIDVLKGDKLTLTLWEKIDGTATDLAGVYGITLTNKVMGNRGQLDANASQVYDLVNSSGMRQVSQRESGQPEYYYTDGKWEERDYPQNDLLQDRVRFLTVYGKSGQGAWRKIDIDIPDMPSSGTLEIQIIGVATLRPTPADRSYGGFPSTGNEVKAFVPKEDMNVRGSLPEYNFEFEPVRLVSFRASYPHLLVTGMFLSKVTSGEDRERNYIPYMYEQPGNYTDSIEDIDILNADEDNDDHVGVIRVMHDGESVFSDKWDTWGEEFGWDNLGMILAKSVMQGYSVPYRKIDGDFVAPDMDFGSRVFIERTGGAKYVILRGTINYINNRFSGTIVQIGAGELPDINRAPDWQPNGVTRCQKEIDTGLNNGMVEVQEVDINPKSQTFMQARWVDSEEDTDYCPIGQATPLYWGAVTEGELPEIENLRYYPYEKDVDSYRVEYNNDGTGRYLMVYFLASLGELRSVLEIENEESITSWEPMDDVEINGLTYRGFRMWYVTGTFRNHPKTFIIN